jgi:hypothetical protein
MIDSRALAKPAPEPAPNRPLWRVMDDAFMKARPQSSHGIAAELRAIAQWIRAKHLLPLATETYIGANVVAAELLAEADRAEAGDAAD